MRVKPRLVLAFSLLGAATVFAVAYFVFVYFNVAFTAFHSDFTRAFLVNHTFGNVGMASFVFYSLACLSLFCFGVIRGWSLSRSVLVAALVFGFPAVMVLTYGLLWFAPTQMNLHVTNFAAWSYPGGCFYGQACYYLSNWVVLRIATVSEAIAVCGLFLRSLGGSW